jgi:DNA-binding SARP family transcriptional activator
LLYHYGHHAAWEQGLACARKILDLDPLREEIHREMMRLYYKSGHRALALKQYEKCRENLASELDILPMEETQILHAQISQNAGGELTGSNSQLDLVTARKLLSQLRRNIHDFEKSTEMLRRSAKSLEKAITDWKLESGGQIADDG